MTARIQLDRPDLMGVDHTPAYIYGETALATDATAARVALSECGADLLFAMKACAFIPVLERLRALVAGLHASSLFETRLARDILGSGGLIHVTTPAIAPNERAALVGLADMISCNSVTQWDAMRGHLGKGASFGLRLNPEMSFINDERYDPCRRHSKLGAPVDEVAEVLARDPRRLEGLEGVLIHTNSESRDFRELLATVERLDALLAPLLRRLEWINLGGGYLFRDGTDYAALKTAVAMLTSKYGLRVFMEPGTSIVQRAGSLIATVLDVVRSGGQTVAVLDASVNHLPESFELQYEPAAWDALETSGHRYILAGATCLAGDIFGDFEFAEPLVPGSRVAFRDVGAYSMVKAHMFNGVNLPAAYWQPADGPCRLVKQFGYRDFFERCGGLRDETV